MTLADMVVALSVLSGKAHFCQTGKATVVNSCPRKASLAHLKIPKNIFSSEMSPKNPTCSFRLCKMCLIVPSFWDLKETCRLKHV